MPVSNLTSVAQAAITAANVLLVSPQSTVGYQPQVAPGLSVQEANLPPILFHYEGEQSILLKSNITDHFTEDNTAIQNHIALPPPTITTQGFIGELTDIPPTTVLAAARAAAQKLVTISGYTPNLSLTALLAYNEAVQAYNTANLLVTTAVAAFDSITGTGGESFISGNGFLTVEPNQTKQQQYFQQFYGYWATRTLFTVQTPWAIFEDMAIESIRPIQGADTVMITDFEVTFKQIRFAVNQTTNGTFTNTANVQGRLQNQAATQATLGTSALTPSSTTLSSVLGL